MWTSNSDRSALIVPNGGRMESLWGTFAVFPFVHTEKYKELFDRPSPLKFTVVLSVLDLGHLYLHL